MSTEGRRERDGICGIIDCDGHSFLQELTRGQGRRWESELVRARKMGYEA